MPGAFKTADTKHWGEGKTHVYLGGTNGVLLCKPNSPLPVGDEVAFDAKITCKRCKTALKKGRLD